MPLSDFRFWYELILGMRFNHIYHMSSWPFYLAICFDTLSRNSCMRLNNVLINEINNSNIGGLRRRGSVIQSLPVYPSLPMTVYQLLLVGKGWGTAPCTNVLIIHNFYLGAYLCSQLFWTEFNWNQTIATIGKADSMIPYAQYLLYFQLNGQS